MLILMYHQITYVDESCFDFNGDGGKWNEAFKFTQDLLSQLSLQVQMPG